MMDFETLLAEVGDFGPFQIILFFLICLPASLPSAFSAFNQPFVVGQPAHRCRLPEGREDLNPEEMSCQQYSADEIDFIWNSTADVDNMRKLWGNLKLIPCQMGWIYDNSTYIDTLVTEVSSIKT
ncbi:unnamed protein product [Gongylonema pulchrum]|uniref:Solute carrier family 22 member 2 n=1 Tax=Gongylonema pulchrum TaxID=637853 RepID=A0A183CV85_9BILA|nr:unnamed protein product [Gongylonema pulchrum]